MEREERLHTLLQTLLAERPEYASLRIPAGVEERALLLRSLMNVREPMPLSETLLRVQNEELTFQREAKGVVAVETLPASPLYPQLVLWQGDITRLQADAIVNAANNRMLGCFVPLHACIDNAIHSAAGMQMRQACHAQMQELGREAHTGEVLMTEGYNLPARYVLHVTGPVVAAGTPPTAVQSRQLADCYTHCLQRADEEGLESIAFCCLSTGVFHFPQAAAAAIAVRTANAYLEQHPRASLRRVVFNVFKDEDLHLYRKLLGYE